MTNAAKKQSEGVQKKLDIERAERATREKLEAEQAALKLLAHRKHTLAFNTEWSGHPTAKYLEQVEEFNVWYDAGEKSGEVFRQPMVVNKNPVYAELRSEGGVCQLHKSSRAALQEEQHHEGTCRHGTEARLGPFPRRFPEVLARGDSFEGGTPVDAGSDIPSHNLLLRQRSQFAGRMGAAVPRIVVVLVSGTHELLAHSG